MIPFGERYRLTYHVMDQDGGIRRYYGVISEIQFERSLLEGGANVYDLVRYHADETLERFWKQDRIDLKCARAERYDPVREEWREVRWPVPRRGAAFVFSAEDIPLTPLQHLCWP